MSVLSLVKVHFDRRGPHATQDWLDARYQFFHDYTLRSLQAQSFKGFLLWIHCDPGMETMVGKLRFLVPPGTIFTFQPYGGRPWEELNAQQQYRMLEADYVYVTRIDSDDLYAPDALALTRAVGPVTPGGQTTELSVFRQGYLHDLKAGKLATYYNAFSPFHTLMFPRKTFLDKALYARSFIGDHSQLGGKYPTHSLPPYRFTVLIHGNNFLSDFSYGRVRGPRSWVERGWTADRFIAAPVVFDVDDFCDEWGAATLADLDRLRARYHDFHCTLFTIPARTGEPLLKEARKRPWLELGVHGVHHEPNEELLSLSGAELRRLLGLTVDWRYYTRVFRPPAWAITAEHVEVCNSLGMSVALHVRDEDALGPLCKYGYYTCRDRWPHWHGHTHDVCGNWLHAHLDALLERWPREQAFLPVSEAVLFPEVQVRPHSTTTTGQPLCASS